MRQLQQRLFSLVEENETLGQDLVELDKTSKREGENLSLKQRILEQEKNQLKDQGIFFFVGLLNK